MKFVTIFFGTWIMLSASSGAHAELSGSQLSCLLEPSSEILLSSQVSGIVSRVNAERGGMVKKNQILLSLESELERAALRTVIARADFASRKLNRNQELLEQGLLSDFERDELVTEQQLARLTVAEAEARLKQRDIRSPIKGVVVKRHVSIGEYVGSEPVMELMALNPLYAEIVMRSDSYGQVSKGMKVKVKIVHPSGDGSETEVAGKVVVVDRVIDAASNTFGFRVKVNNPDLSLPAGLKCRIAFN
ncbi:MAG: efflux RND transporter periplasmic adaptor subunit [Gammaproteobacteria bacterium]|nr:efflux RND transporter periplasmic adaptor subunit [Gammaproteobacteria bacterium]MBQ0838840.1 efflux RND transporter periplasmic adaptor subunit [Gammaproteobacteria bacterium]